MIPYIYIYTHHIHIHNGPSSQAWTYLCSFIGHVLLIPVGENDPSRFDHGSESAIGWFTGEIHRIDEIVHVEARKLGFFQPR